MQNLEGGVGSKSKNSGKYWIIPGVGMSENSIFR